MEQSYKFVRDHKDKPFFLFLPVTIPHAAMQVPEDSIAPYREKFPQFEKLQGKYAGRTVTNPVAAFAGMMTRLDSQIGALQQLLRDSGLEENRFHDVLQLLDGQPIIRGENFLPVYDLVFIHAAGLGRG